MRRLFTLATILSLLLAAAATAAWVRSYWVYDRVSCASYRCTWESFDARLQFSRWPPAMPGGASSAVLASSGKIFVERRIYHSEPLAASGQRWGWASDENVIPSFSYLQAVTADMTRSGHWAVRQVSVRHGALLLLLALLPAAWLIAWSRRSAR
jgi:hypothetical protein